MGTIQAKFHHLYINPLILVILAETLVADVFEFSGYGNIAFISNKRLFR